MLVLWPHKYKVGHFDLILIKHQNLLNSPEIPEFSLCYTHICPFQSFLLQIWGVLHKAHVKKGLCKAPRASLELWEVPIENGLCKAPIDKDLCKTHRGFMKPIEKGSCKVPTERGLCKGPRQKGHHKAPKGFINTYQSFPTDTGVSDKAHI